MALALVLVEPVQMMPVVEQLEIAVGLHHLGALFPHRGFQDRGGVFVVIVGREAYHLVYDDRASLRPPAKAFRIWSLDHLR